MEYPFEIAMNNIISMQVFKTRGHFVNLGVSDDLDERAKGMRLQKVCGVH